MTLELGACSKCGLERLIVNKKYCLCDECNYKRLHGGKSKQDVWSERSGERKSIQRYTKPDTGRTLQEVIAIKGVKKASRLKPISSTAKFRCSDGRLVSQVEVKRRYAETFDRIKIERSPVCQGTGRNDYPLSFSHTISQDRCKQLGKTELIWDADNIEIEGFHEPSSLPVAAHNIWEVGSIEKKIMLLNFDRKLEYIKQHDTEGYNRLMCQIEELESKWK
jgi:hypothetical protein